MSKIIQYKPILTPNHTQKVSRFREWSVTVPEELSLDNPDKIYDLMTKTPNIQIDKNAVEYLYMLCLDNQLHLIGIYNISIGTINKTVISSREIIINAALANAYHIILVHNHPSGDPKPSKLDIDVTLKIRDALKICDIYLTDHIIIGKNNYLSMRESGYFTDKTNESEAIADEE